jgi:hypothetical protein
MTDSSSPLFGVDWEVQYRTFIYNLGYYKSLSTPTVLYITHIDRTAIYSLMSHPGIDLEHLSFMCNMLSTVSVVFYDKNTDHSSIPISHRLLA